MSRFVVGIDLGTTNTALAFVDTEVSSERLDDALVTSLPIDQVTAPGSVEQKPQLPSALYISSGKELSEGALNLPWRHESRFALGSFAREQGSKIPTRFVHSSKSWLCHGGVDREAAILPPNSPEEEARISPVEVSALILKHLVDAWNYHMAREDQSLRLEDQEVTLCVPASFDAGARNLTIAAAEKAGLKNLHLLEEPQAAIYSWIEATGADWREELHEGDLVLVVDVGGGTTDFSLIAVTEDSGQLELRRVAVGEHILLGGDNMDLAIAYGVSKKLENEKNVKLDAWQMSALVQQCRVAKEELLKDSTKDSWPIAILGRGSSVIGGTIRTELPRAGLDEFLVNGFFPLVDSMVEPQKPRRAGFREAGLPYAADAGITRHLAKFLRQHASALSEILPDRAPESGKPIIPTAVLYNGGVFKADPLRQRVQEVLGNWAGEGGKETPRTLGNADLDMAVARGASYIGLGRRGKGVRIRGGSARSYYIGIESAAPAVPGMEPPVKAMCVVPYGMEEGTTQNISGEEIDLCIWAGEPAEFRFLSSTTRRNDEPGDLLDISEEEFVEHNPIETILGNEGDEGRPVEVDLRAHLTDIGVMNLGCVDRKSGDEYRLEFNVRHEPSEAH